MRTHGRRPTSVRRGSTLLELVVVIVLAGTIAGIVSPPLIEATRTRERSVRRAALLGEARTALERIVREFREIPAKSTDANSPDISAAAGDSIAFQAASYRVASGVLERLEANDTTWRPLASHVTAFALTYYDGNGNVLSSTPLSAGDRGNLRRIGVSLALQDGGQSVALRTGAFLRIFSFRNL
jgi:type II secretory pathway pseudopilin PulG